jgi:hypothetical protein
MRHAETASFLELALQELQRERSACVERLCALLRTGQETTETQGYMRRIESINDAVIRLSRAGLKAVESHPATAPQSAQ